MREFKPTYRFHLAWGIMALTGKAAGVILGVFWFSLTTVLTPLVSPGLPQTHSSGCLVDRCGLALSSAESQCKAQTKHYPSSAAALCSCCSGGQQGALMGCHQTI